MIFPRRKPRPAQPLDLSHREALLLWRALQIYRQAPLAGDQANLSAQLQRRIKAIFDGSETSA